MNIHLHNANLCMHLVFIDPGSLEAQDFVDLACDPRLESADVAVTVHKDCDSAVKGSLLNAEGQ